MITFEELAYLQSSEAQELIEKHIEEEPLRLAMKGIPAPVCTQIKYLQKCKHKLPLYYTHRCIILPLSFEQSSSAASASSREYGVELCVDLTCGLGCDALHFAKRFKRVIAVERDPVLAAIAKINFARLGVGNIEVVNDDAEHFIAGYNGEKIDCIYIDPARRNAEKKVFLFQDCSPDVISILPLLCKMSRTLVIKASPLFDVDEAFRLFDKCGGLAVETLSVDDECKELLISIETDREYTKRSKVTIIRKGNIRKFFFNFEERKAMVSAIPGNDAVKYLLIPDVAFYKSRTIPDLMSCYFPGIEYSFLAEAGIVLTADNPDCFPGKVYAVLAEMPYKPKRIKAYLKSEGIVRATLLKRGFPLQPGQARKILGLKEGDDAVIVLAEDTFFHVNPL